MSGIATDVEFECGSGMLPAGWSWTTVGDTGEYINGFAFKPTHREVSGLPIVRIQNLTAPDKPLNRTNISVPAAFHVRTGEMLVSWSATVDVFVWNREPGLVNQHIFRVAPHEGLVDRGFLFHWLKVAIDQLLESEHLHGSTMKHINRGPFMAHRIPLPPRAEQVRIAEALAGLLSDLDAGVAELKAAQRKLAQYRQSLLKAAVEGALTADWRAKRQETSRSSSPRRRGSSAVDNGKALDSRLRGNDEQETGAQLLQRILSERRARWEQKQITKFAEQGKAPPKDWKTKYPAPTIPDIADLPALPEGWTWASVDQCSLDETAITDGPFGSNLKSSHYKKSGPRVLRLQNIGDGYFIDAKAHISDEHYDELKKHSVAEGDLVVAMLGEVLPRACIVPQGVAPAIVKADCARVRLNPNLMMPAMLCAVLNSEPTRKRVVSLVKGIGRPRVNLGNLRSIPVPLPPIAEQEAADEAMKRALEECDRQGAALQHGLRLAAAQRKNLLKAAFSGQLVPQDPNDEPASVLLARLRAEREQLPSTRGKRRAGSTPAPATKLPTQAKRGRKAKERA